eukprot:scaffold185876_cov23-Tisochrysis_lutea.AAC.1
MDCGEKWAPFVLANGQRGSAGARRERIRGSGSRSTRVPQVAQVTCYLSRSHFYSLRTARGASC